MINTITFVRGDDTTFLNQVLLIAYFKTNLNLDGYHAKLTIENPHNIMRKFEVQHNSVEIELDKIITSTIDIGKHKANIKLIDTLDRVRTIYNFEIEVKDENDISDIPMLNEYEFEIAIDSEGISKYKNYDELHNKPSINNVVLEGNKTFDEIGATRHMIGISNTGIDIHNTDKTAHRHLQDQIFNKQDRLIAGSNITIIDGIISALGDNGGVTTDYKDLGNKPRINGKVLDDDLTLEELGIQPKGEYITEEILNQKGFLTSVPTGYVTEQELEEKNFLTQIPEDYYTNTQNQEIYTTKEENNLKQDVLTAGENINIFKDEENGTTTISAEIPEDYLTTDELLKYNYTTDDKLTNLLDRKQNIILAGDNIRMYKNIDGTYTISAIDSKNPSEIASYNALNNKPTINNILLTGNKTLEELGIQKSGNYQDKLVIGQNIEISSENVISCIIPDYLCTDAELSTELAKKADKANTLLGYNIEDAYNKDEVDNNIFNYYKNKLTDIIIEASNNVIEYTENTITAKKDLRVLFSNGLNTFLDYINIDKTLENDIILNVNDYKDEINNFCDFYITLFLENNSLKLRLTKKSEFKILNINKINNTTQGYVKNIYTNEYYKMVDTGHGIYSPEKVNMLFIGECTCTVLKDGSIRIYNIFNYLPYQIVTQNILLQQLKDYQPKIQFGENFILDGNVINYLIPRNYVTKEYLIENNFTTQTNINDAIDIHNTKENAHKDIRELISNLTSKLNDKADYSFFNILSEKIIELEDKVNIIQNEYNALEKIENLLKEV